MRAVFQHPATPSYQPSTTRRPYYTYYMCRLLGPFVIVHHRCIFTDHCSQFILQSLVSNELRCAVETRPKWGSLIIYKYLSVYIYIYIYIYIDARRDEWAVELRRCGFVVISTYLGSSWYCIMLSGWSAWLMYVRCGAWLLVPADRQCRRRAIRIIASFDLYVTSLASIVGSLLLLQYINILH